MAPLRKTNAPQPPRVLHRQQGERRYSAGAGKPNTTYYFGYWRGRKQRKPMRAYSAPTLSNGSANSRSARAKAC